jgi:hypothetical protein
MIFAKNNSPQPPETILLTFAIKELSIESRFTIALSVPNLNQNSGLLLGNEASFVILQVRRESV